MFRKFRVFVAVLASLTGTIVGLVQFQRACEPLTFGQCADEWLKWLASGGSAEVVLEAGRRAEQRKLDADANIRATEAQQEAEATARRAQEENKVSIEREKETRRAALPPLKESVAEQSAEESISEYIEFEYLQDREKFAPLVDYYAKGMVDKLFIARDKAEYAAKWPQRRYSMIPGTLQIRSAGGEDYIATFGYSFSVSNDRDHKEGQGRTQLRLQRQFGTYYVMGIKEVVSN